MGKLKAVDRKRATGTKVEGRKSYREIDARDDNGRTINLAEKLRRMSPKGGRRSLRAISAEMAKAGFLGRTGKPYTAAAVVRMLGNLVRRSVSRLTRHSSGARYNARIKAPAGSEEMRGVLR